MRKTINIFWVVGVLACVLVVYFAVGNNMDTTIEGQEATIAQVNVTKNEENAKKSNLTSTLEMVGTEAFIENQARQLYRYMLPDETRFIITNPEALYGDTEIPSR